MVYCLCSKISEIYKRLTLNTFKVKLESNFKICLDILSFYRMSDHFCSFEVQCIFQFPSDQFGNLGEVVSFHDQLSTFHGDNNLQTNLDPFRDAPTALTSD